MPFVLAGMPVPLWILTPPAERRIEAISFFVLTVLLSAWAVKSLWNRALREAFGWPQIDYRRSLAVVAVWGCGFVLILTMISGARELMTPGAWEQDGATYRLRDEPPDEEAVPVEFEIERAERIEGLWTALEGRANVAGRYPARDELEGVDWSLPQRPGAVYQYRGTDVEFSDDVLAHEPDVYSGVTFVLRANGRVERLPYASLVRELDLD